MLARGLSDRSLKLRGNLFFVESPHSTLTAWSRQLKQKPTQTTKGPTVIPILRPTSCLGTKTASTSLVACQTFRGPGEHVRLARGGVRLARRFGSGRFIGEAPMKNGRPPARISSSRRAHRPGLRDQQFHAQPAIAEALEIRVPSHPGAAVLQSDGGVLGIGHQFATCG
jgi:hypothetical protein